MASSDQAARPMAAMASTSFLTAFRRPGNEAAMFVVKAGQSTTVVEETMERKGRGEGGELKKSCGHAFDRMLAGLHSAMGDVTQRPAVPASIHTAPGVSTGQIRRW